MPEMIINFGLQPGDILVQCRTGFTWNNTKWTGAHIPDEVRVIKEYPRFILVEASFKNNYGKSYKECINKGAVLGGYCYFRKWTRGE